MHFQHIPQEKHLLRQEVRFQKGSACRPDYQFMEYPENRSWCRALSFRRSDSENPWFRVPLLPGIDTDSHLFGGFRWPPRSTQVSHVFVGESCWSIAYLCPHGKLSFGLGLGFFNVQDDTCPAWFQESPNTARRPDQGNFLIWGFLKRTCKSVGSRLYVHFFLLVFRVLRYSTEVTHIEGIKAPGRHSVSSHLTSNSAPDWPTSHLARWEGQTNELLWHTQQTLSPWSRPGKRDPGCVGYTETGWPLCLKKARWF